MPAVATSEFPSIMQDLPDGGFEQRCYRLSWTDISLLACGLLLCGGLGALGLSQTQWTPTLTRVYLPGGGMPCPH